MRTTVGATTSLAPASSGIGLASSGRKGTIKDWGSVLGIGFSLLGTRALVDIGYENHPTRSTHNRIQNLKSRVGKIWRFGSYLTMQCCKFISLRNCSRAMNGFDSSINCAELQPLCPQILQKERVKPLCESTYSFSRLREAPWKKSNTFYYSREI